MVRNKVLKKENRKQIDLAKSLSSTSRSTQGWEPTGFPAKVRLNISTHRAWKGLKAKRYSPNFIILPIFGPNEANWREKQASKSGQVEVSLPSSCSTASSELATFFFSSLVATLATKLFPATTKYHYCSESFQHGLLATRISKRRDFLTCRSSSTGPSNFLATPPLPVMRTQTIIVKVVYLDPYILMEEWTLEERKQLFYKRLFLQIADAVCSNIDCSI